MRSAAIVFLILVFAGCALPVSQHNFVLPDGMDAKKAALLIKVNSENTLTGGNILNTLTFYFGPKAMTAIGPTGFDESSRKIAVAAIDPVGVTLFRLVSRNDQMVSSFVMPGFSPADGQQMAQQVIADIGHIYFDRAVTPFAEDLYLMDDRILFEKRIDNKDLLYTFTGPELMLAGKSLSDDAGEIWSVAYDDYRKVENQWLPFKIVFKHYKYGYTIEIRTKEIMK